MNLERENLLKYGEYIVLISKSKGKNYYLSARSLLEEEVYFI